MNGIIYCRVSSREQIEGTSLESQEQACREFAHSKNIKILKIFIEEGESAKFADRTKLVELIDFCRVQQGKIETLIVWKVDRFARNVTDHFKVKEILKKYGVQIVSVTEPIDSKPEGKLMETVLAGFAQFDNDIRAIRTVQGMKKKIQEGIFPWKPPLGYKSAVRNGEKKNTPDEPDQPLFGVLQSAWKELLTGAFTKAEIRRMIRSWGYTMSPQSIDNLFANNFYAGILTDPWSGEEYAGQHIPMISQAEFTRAKEIISKRNRSLHHVKQRSEFPVRGLIRCSTCKNCLTASFSRGRSRSYPYYHCANKKCELYGKSFPAEIIHEQFSEFLIKVEPKSDLFEKIHAFILQLAEERQTSSNSRNNEMLLKRERLNSQLQEIISMRAQALINNEEFLKQKFTLFQRKMALENNISSQVTTVDSISEKLNELSAPLKELSQTWSALPLLLKDRFQRYIFPVGFLNGKIGTAQLGLLFKLFVDFPNSKSSVVSRAVESWNQLIEEIQGLFDLFTEYSEVEDLSREAV